MPYPIVKLFLGDFADTMANSTGVPPGPLAVRAEDEGRFCHDKNLRITSAKIHPNIK